MKRGFDELEKRLVEEGRRCPPDFERMKALVMAGADVNACSDDFDEEQDTPLSLIYLGYLHDNIGENGRYLPELTRFFLENGFDVHEDEGRHGAACLQNLTWSSYDQYILEAAKILLEAGADPNVVLYGDESALDWVSVKISGSYVEHDEDAVHLFEKMYDMMKEYV